MTSGDVVTQNSENEGYPYEPKQSPKLDQLRSELNTHEDGDNKESLDESNDQSYNLIYDRSRHRAELGHVPVGGANGERHQQDQSQKGLNVCARGNDMVLV